MVRRVGSHGFLLFEARGRAEKDLCRLLLVGSSF